MNGEKGEGDVSFFFGRAFARSDDQNLKLAMKSELQYASTSILKLITTGIDFLSAL